MNGNGKELKPIAQLYVNTDGKLVINTDVKNMIVLAKWLAQGLHSIVKQIPDGEKKQIVEPQFRMPT